MKAYAPIQLFPGRKVVDPDNVPTPDKNTFFCTSRAAIHAYQEGTPEPNTTTKPPTGKQNRPAETRGWRLSLKAA